MCVYYSAKKKVEAYVAWGHAASQPLPQINYQHETVQSHEAYSYQNEAAQPHGDFNYQLQVLQPHVAYSYQPQPLDSYGRPFYQQEVEPNLCYPREEKYHNNYEASRREAMQNMESTVSPYQRALVFLPDSEQEASTKAARIERHLNDEGRQYARELDKQIQKSADRYDNFHNTQQKKKNTNELEDLSDSMGHLNIKTTPHEWGGSSTSPEYNPKSKKVPQTSRAWIGGIFGRKKKTK